MLLRCPLTTCHWCFQPPQLKAGRATVWVKLLAWLVEQSNQPSRHQASWQPRWCLHQPKAYSQAWWFALHGHRNALQVRKAPDWSKAGRAANLHSRKQNLRHSQALPKAKGQRCRLMHSHQTPDQTTCRAAPWSCKSAKRCYQSFQSKCARHLQKLSRLCFLRSFSKQRSCQHRPFATRLADPARWSLSPAWTRTQRNLHSLLSRHLRLPQVERLAGFHHQAPNFPKPLAKVLRRCCPWQFPCCQQDPASDQVCWICHQCCFLKVRARLWSFQAHELCWDFELWTCCWVVQSL